MEWRRGKIFVKHSYNRFCVSCCLLKVPFLHIAAGKKNIYSLFGDATNDVRHFMLSIPFQLYTTLHSTIFCAKLVHNLTIAVFDLSKCYGSNLTKTPITCVHSRFFFLRANSLPIICRFWLDI